MNSYRVARIFKFRRPKKPGSRRPSAKRIAQRASRIVIAPAATGRVTVSGIGRNPSVRSVGRNMRIVHTERFDSVRVPDSNLNVVTYRVNPGLSTCFPWLCDVANRFEKYKFHSLTFRYVSQSAATTGTVSLAFDFDPNDDPPESMEQANTYNDFVVASIWANDVKVKVDLVNGDRLPQKNTRPGMPSGQVELNVYDVGQLFLMTEGAATATVGYLEVSYDVELFIHQIQTGVGGRGASTEGLDKDNLVGTDFTADREAYLPCIALSASRLLFTQPYEGLVHLQYHSNSEVSPLTDGILFNTAAGTQIDVLKTFINETCDEGFALCRIRALIGSQLGATLMGTPIVSWARWYFGKGGYNSYE